MFERERSSEQSKYGTTPNILTQQSIERDWKRITSTALTDNVEEIEKLLTVISNEFPHIGYTQGMNEVAW